MVTIMKTTFRKPKPKIICYRQCRDFFYDTFRKTLLEVLSQTRITNNDDDLITSWKFVEAL